MTPEGKIKAKVKKALDTLPRCYRFMPVQQGLGAPALDFYCCISTRFIGIETKAKGKGMTARQLETAREINDAGGLVFLVCDDISLAYMMQGLKRICP